MLSGSPMEVGYATNWETPEKFVWFHEISGTGVTGTLLLMLFSSTPLVRGCLHCRRGI